MKKTILVALVAFLSSASMAAFSAEAVNNATIQLAGPRGGGNGKNFFNIEGAGVAEQFRSWGAADFTASSFGIGFSVSDVSNFKVILTEANAAFTLPGKIDFWLTTDTTNSIDPGVSPFVWQNGVSPEGAGNQLPLTYLGKGDFTTTGNVNSGQVNTYAIVLSQTAEDILINALNSNGNIRLVITPDSVNGPDTVSATFAGFSNNTYTGPVLEFDASGGGSTTETLAPSGEAILLGSGSGGNLASWAADDNDARTVCKFFVPNATSPFVRVNLNYTTTKTSPTAISFDVKVSTHTPGPQSITLNMQNKVNSAFVATSVNGAASINGTTYNGVPTGALADYVGGGGAMTGQIEIRQTGPSTALLPCSSFEFGQMVVTG